MDAILAQMNVMGIKWDEKGGLFGLLGLQKNSLFDVRFRHLRYSKVKKSAKGMSRLSNSLLLQLLLRQ